MGTKEDCPIWWYEIERRNVNYLKLYKKEFL